MNMSDKEIIIAFGTETGNAEMLAEDAASAASSFDLEGKVCDMEDLSVDDLSSAKMVIIVCSTWGEGDQPDNAQDLYDDVCDSDDGCMDGVNFAVLALGDTAFEMFCESGKEWDRILEEKGGTRVHERIDCDTDYEDYADEWIEEALAKFQSI
jgi:sulfite reductase (NADPH) flavoprotein alpha-component